jgi:protocatechuate 3,4-dioxygenase beta subunit
MNSPEHEKRPDRPRVWLVGITSDPADQPVVRDTRMRTWQPGDDGRYHSADGWHHATWTELHSRYDLVEVA